MQNPFKKNDILYSSWGYDQTNIDFYLILSTTEKTVTLVKIGNEESKEDGFMTSIVKPLPNKIISEPFKRKVKKFIDYFVTIESCENAKLLDTDKGKRCTWYG